MKEATDIDDLRNKALQKIGRNVVAFQKMEAMLKFLIANQRIEGLPDQLLKIQEHNTKAVDRQTMGSLVDKLFRQVISDGSDSSTDHVAAEGAWSVSFSVESDESDTRESKAALRNIVEDRNTLIHKMLVKFDPTSSDSCQMLSRDLDLQRDKIKPQFENLRAMVNAVVEGRKELLDFIESDGFLEAVANQSGST